MNRIKELRKERNWTQDILANKLGVQTAAVSKYERGTLTLSTETAIKLCSIFNVSLDYLLGINSDTEKSNLIQSELQNTINKFCEKMDFSYIDFINWINDIEKIKILQTDSEEKLLNTFRQLNNEYQSIAYGEILKLKKEQEKEQYFKITSSVAAEEAKKTGTDNLGK